jgi:hypothetical protein
MVAGARFCQACGAKLPAAPEALRVGAIAVDASGGSSVINIGAAAPAGVPGEHCPICGTFNRPDTTFRCKNCGRAYLCTRHQDSATFWCAECAATRAGAGAPTIAPAALFQVNYQFQRPFLPRSTEALARLLVSFRSSEGLDATAVTSVPLHLCLVLDVSGSMNREDKYPLLRRAIPRLVEALSDDDCLTMVLFSRGCDVVASVEPIAACRKQLPALLERIDRSGVKFGDRTLLAPALRRAADQLEHARQKMPTAADRVYILTDGELHDAEACRLMNPRFRALEAELHSYGFGPEFALDSMKAIMEGVPGGTVKPILDTRAVMDTFGHIGELSDRIMAREAEFIFTFAPAVIAGDAFRYEPGSQYFGAVDRRSKTFSVKLGNLERGRRYTFLFEGQVRPATGPEEAVGKAELRYRRDGGLETVETAVVVGRSDEPWHLVQVDEVTAEICAVLDALRRDDPGTQLRALRARQAIYRREGADPQLMALVDLAIAKVERGETLDEDEDRGLKADRSTQVGGGVPEGLRSLALSWLQRGESQGRMKWLTDLVERVEQATVSEVLRQLPPPQHAVLMAWLKGGDDPLRELDSAALKAFDDSLS